MTRFAAIPSGIMMYEPEELVLRAGAGTSLVEIREELGRKGQRLRVPMLGSLGGSVATRRNGIHPSDNAAYPNIVLMCVARDGRGNAFTAGGPTVKNVSGFDLVKVLVGSWGTLATIEDVTLRTEPIPQCSRWFKGTGPTGHIFRPSVVWRQGEATLINIEGHPEDVSAQAKTLDGFVEIDAPTPEEELLMAPVRAHNAAPSGPLLDICRRLKESFDPDNILSPDISVAWGIV